MKHVVEVLMQINAADLTYAHSRDWLYVPEGSRMLDQISKSHHAGNKENTTGPSDDLASEKATLKNTIPGISTIHAEGRVLTAVRTRSNADSALLGVDIAGKLLPRLNSNEVHTTLPDWLVETSEQMSTEDKVELPAIIK